MAYECRLELPGFCRLDRIIDRPHLSCVVADVASMKIELEISSSCLDTIPKYQVVQDYFRRRA